MFLHLEFLIPSAPSSIFVVLTQDTTQKPYCQGYLKTDTQRTPCKKYRFPPKNYRNKDLYFTGGFIEASYFEVLPTLTMDYVPLSRL